jgi:carnitine 3-dehydrogenase
MRPLRVRKEIDAYIGDRLQEAIWREALHLINDGVASVAEIDAAITGGPGLRWAFMGTLLGWHLGSGPGGMRQNLTQFGPALELPWCHMQAPELTEALQTRIIEGCDEETGQRQFSELERKRDRCLIEIQKVLAQHWYPPGEDGWPDFQSSREVPAEPSTGGDSA